MKAGILVMVRRAWVALKGNKHISVTVAFIYYLMA
jgi:hypothetical protein